MQRAASPPASAAAAAPSLPFEVRDLGLIAYQPAFELQHRLNEALIEGRSGPVLLLVEHHPVITLTPRPGVDEHLLASAERLAKLGIEVRPTNRGGDVTYHGPGQLVAYPILRLADIGPGGTRLTGYMRLLEQAVIDTLGTFGLVGHREPGATGVWVQPGSPRSEPGGPVRAQAPRHKVCAMGVRIRKGCTLHGLALNVDPDLSHFATIVPCGLRGRVVTSLRVLLGEACPDMACVKRELVAALGRAVRKGPPDAGA